MNLLGLQGYYKRAQDLQDSPLPPDFPIAESQIGDEGSSVSQSASSALHGLNVDEEEERKQRQDREQIKDKAVKVSGRVADQLKQASMKGSVKSFEKIGLSSRKAEPDSTISPVIPQSASMRKRLAPKLDGRSDNARLKRTNSGSVSDTNRTDTDFKGHFARLVSTNMTGSTGNQFEKDIEYADAYFRSGDYVAAGSIVSSHEEYYINRINSLTATFRLFLQLSKVPESDRTISAYLLLIQLHRKKVKDIP